MSSSTPARRADVLDAVGRALDAGTGVLVTGAPGMGRTTLLRAVQDDPDRDVVRITAAPATAPVTLGALARFLPAGYTADGTAAVGAVRGALGDLAAAGTVLGLDDVHHLDGVSAALVADAVRDGLRVVLTAREGAEVPPPLGALRAEGLLDHVPLAPLTPAEAAILVRTVAGGGASTTAVRWAVDLGEGNPSLLAELARIAPRPGLERLPLTDRLRRALAAHLEDLDEPATVAITLLAYDPPLPLALLVDAAGTEALEALEHHGLVAVGDGPAHLVSLAHPLLAEVVLAEVGAARRADVAGALLAGVARGAVDRRGHDLPDAVVRHARWQLDAGEVVDLDGMAEAGRLLLARWDPAGAERLARVVLARRPEDAGAALLLAGAALLRGDHRAAERWFETAWRLPAATPEQRLQARLGRAQSAFFGRGDRDAAQAALGRAGHLGADGDAEAGPQAAGHGGDEGGPGGDATAALAAMIALCSGDMSAAETLSRQVGPGAPPELRLVGLAVAHVAVASAGRLGTAWQITEEAVPLLRDPAVAPEHLVRMTAGRAYLRLHLGDLGGVLDEADGPRPPMAPPSAAVLEVGKAAAHLVMGRGDLARACVDQVDVALADTDPYGHRAYVGAVAAEVAALQGRRDAAMAAARLAGAHHRPHLGWWAWAVPAADGWAQAATHRFGRARAMMRRAADMAAVNGDRLHQCMCLLALVRLGEAGGAGALAEVAERIEGDLWPAVGVAARGLAHPTDPAGLLEEGCGRLVELGAHLWAVDLLGRGAALDRRDRRDGRAGRRQAAAEHQALALVELSPPVLAELRGTPADGLTPRQWEIATLAAEGWTSRQVADHLVLSVRTVDNHLSRVYQALGVRGRADLADALCTRRDRAPDPDHRGDVEAGPRAR